MYKTNEKLLKEQMKEKRVSFEELAEKVGCDRATLYRRLQNGTLRIADMLCISDTLSLDPAMSEAIFLNRQ